MNDLNDRSGVWFVYDGDCPVCTHAAEALRIKQEYGSLNTLNARDEHNDPLLGEINRRGIDLDEGMVIYADGSFYHGKGALKFMASHGDNKNMFMSIFKGLFWSDVIARLTYPWMRACRNWLLRRKNVGRIDNLKLKKSPTFQAIFGSEWDNLPAVMQKHYANHPYSNEVTAVEGKLDVYCKPPLLWLSPIMKLMGQVPAFNETNVPVTVHFESDVNSKAFHFNRMFSFSNGSTYKFKSRMLQISGDEVVEIMRFGLGWKMRYGWNGEQVTLTHKGYALYFLGHFIPLPLTFLMGSGNAIEYPVDDNTFDMEVNITHPLWGDMYGYKGRFEVIK